MPSYLCLVNFTFRICYNNALLEFLFMQLGLEYQPLELIINACLSIITAQRSRLRKTKSQIPATSELWFLETQLKGVNSPSEFLTWIKEIFCPQFVSCQSKIYPDANSYINCIFNELALEILRQVKQSNLFEKETQEFITTLIKKAQEPVIPECPPTPILRSPSRNETSETQENLSETINQSSPK